MKSLVAVAIACVLSACSTAQSVAESPSYVIHNPGIYASVQPLMDDGGVSLAIPSATQGPFSWANGIAGMAD